MKFSQLPSLCTVFIEPKLVLNLNLRQWDLLIRQARSANVMAKLGYLFDSAGILNQIPAQPHTHIKSAHTYADRFHISTRLEITCIQDALKAVNVPLVLLKGSAYFIAGNNAAKGRIFSDVDILVPENKLHEVEIALIKEGWMTNNRDPYNQKYYRQWMHELPPLRHLRRQTTIDVHHNILPKTSRFCPDASMLLTNIVKIPDLMFGFWRLKTGCCIVLRIYLTRGSLHMVSATCRIWIYCLKNFQRKKISGRNCCGVPMNSINRFPCIMRCDIPIAFCKPRYRKKFLTLRNNRCQTG
jgi:hypothetical protein